MSWSFYSTGKASAAAAQIAEAATKVSLTDAGEMETVAKVADLIAQTLGTFDPDQLVNVAAAGSMNFKDWTAKTGCTQNVSVKIEPIHLSV